MSPADKRYDAIVVGGGHNGLAAAALLAKRGRETLVLEARETIGGLAASDEFLPGYRTPGVLHDTAGVRPWVIDVLDLERHGLTRRTDPPALFAPRKNGAGLLLAHSRDPDSATTRSVGVSDRDRRSLGEYLEFLQRIGPVLKRLFDNPPPNAFDPGLGDLLRLGSSAVSLRRLGKTDMMELLRIAPMCVADWLDEWFDSALLKAALAAPALDATFTGPRSPGSTTNLLRLEALTETPIAGGPPALVRALVDSAVASGAKIQTRAEVDRILCDGDRVTGVRLVGGETIEASSVVASCDPKQVFLSLLPAASLSLKLGRNFDNFRARGTTAKVHLALRSLPSFAGSPVGHREPIERVRIVETLDHLERAFDAVKYRQVSENPVLDISFPSVETPELAPAGHHVASILVHFAPYDLDGGWTERARESVGRSVVKVLSEYAPGLEDLIVGQETLSPADLAQRYRLTNGHLHHGEHALDQLAIRPSPDCSSYATPFSGLYLCGSGSHPGGGLTCGPGALAAQTITRG